MKKKELVTRATEILHDKDVRKSVPAIKTKLRILDEENNESCFVVKAERKGYLLNESDVSAVLDALLETTTEAMRNGDEIMLYGLGTLKPHRIAARPVTMVDGSGVKMIKEHLVPRFFPGKPLKMAVKMYEMDLEEAERGEAGGIDDAGEPDGD